MFRAIPRPNRLCSEKKVKQDHTLHRKKIQEMKPFIGIMEPQTYGFLNSRKKQEQMQEIRFTEIDRENKMLLQKISTIMTKIPPGIILIMTKKLFIFFEAWALSSPLKTNYSKFWESSYQKSLNKTYRKKELVKITFENQALLRRIQEKRQLSILKILRNKGGKRRSFWKIFQNILCKFTRRNSIPQILQIIQEIILCLVVAVLRFY